MQRTGVAVAEDDGKGERCRPARSFETPPRPDPSPPGSSGRAGRSVLADKARREGLWGLGRAPLHSSVAPGGRRSVWRKGTSSPHSVLRDAARSNHPPTAPQDEREGGEVYVGPDASTGSRHRRVAAATARTVGGAARTRGGLTGGYNADIAAWGEALPDSKSPIGRGSPSIEEWTRFMGASPLRRFALARLCLTSNL